MKTEEAIRATIRDRLHSLLSSKGIEQKELAGKIYVRQQTISNYLSGKRKIPLYLLPEIADFLGCTTDYLMGRTDSPDPWNTTAVDALGLSETAVDIIHGEFPYHRAFLESVKDKLGEEDYQREIEILDRNKPFGRAAAVRLLETKGFEDALIALQRAIDFTIRAEQKSKLPEYESMDDSKWLLDDGRYSVDVRDVAKIRAAAAVKSFQKAVDEVLGNYKGVSKMLYGKEASTDGIADKESK